LDISPAWLRIFFPFWPTEAFDGGWSSWLHGWQVVPAIIFWHHATTLIRPGEMNWWRWTRVSAGYLVAITGIWVLYEKPLLFADVSGDPLYLHTLIPGPLYLPTLVVFLLFIVFCLINIIRSIGTTESKLYKRQLLTMAIATVIAGFTAPTAFVAAVFGIPIPRLAFTILLFISVAMIGYGVARYSALIEGRTIRRDFVYSAIITGFVVLIYSMVTWVSIKVFNVPLAAYVFVLIIVIVTHNLVDVTRHTLDAIFYQRENQQIRANLRKLANQVGDRDLGKNISSTLETMCNSVRSTYGLVLKFDGGRTDLLSTYNFQTRDLTQPIEDFWADDILHLTPNHFPSPLDEAALLVPLYVDATQIGAMIFGRPANSTNFSKEDVDLLLYPSDGLAEIIYKAQKETEYLQQISEIVEQKNDEDRIPVKDVEKALRNIYDYAYLGDLPIANLKLVETRLSKRDVTHIDRGKMVNQVLAEAVEKLRPEIETPKDQPSREWFPYLILHGAYLDDQLNRDIMSRLYISEGTFNRTRRSAIRSVARVLGELETRYH